MQLLANESKSTNFSFAFSINEIFRSKKMRGGGGIDFDENELSKDGENSLSQSLFDDQTSSRTRK